jgi:cystathionine gamma-synthase
LSVTLPCHAESRGTLLSLGTERLVALCAALNVSDGQARKFADVTGAPFDSYLTLRGLRTLYARLNVHGENAAAIAQLLAVHPAVSHVYYPGLSSHPQHALASVQQSVFGEIVSFELIGGISNVCAFLKGLRCFSLAESLGGVESLVAHPATMTHAAMDAEARRRAGISDTLLRLSIGIEAKEDLSADVSAALERAASVREAV